MDDYRTGDRVVYLCQQGLVTRRFPGVVTNVTPKRVMVKLDSRPDHEKPRALLRRVVERERTEQG